MQSETSLTDGAVLRTAAAKASLDRAPNVPARQTRKRWRRRLLLIGIALLIVATLVVMWLPEPLVVDVAVARRGPLAMTIDEDGRTRVKDRYIVSAPTSGQVARIELRPGDAVVPGTVLARILPLAPAPLDARSREQAQARAAAAIAARRRAETAVEAARTALEFAQRESARERGLIQSGAIAQRTLERTQLEERRLRDELRSAEFALKVAVHEQVVAQAALSGADVRRRDDQAEIAIESPIAGRVLRVIQESEGAVQPGTPLLEVGDDAALEIVVDVLTSDAADIRPGAPVSIERWSRRAPLRGHVRTIEPSAFTRMSALGVEEQRVNVVIDIDDPRTVWAALGDGYRVETRIETFRETDALSVPEGAVFRRGSGWGVFTVQDDRARLVNVEIGLQTPDRVQIASGLVAGQQVIVHPSERVENGARVVAPVRDQLALWR